MNVRFLWGEDGLYEAFPSLILVHVKINGVGVGSRGSGRFVCGRRPVTTLWTAAGGNESNRGASLAFQLGHGICAILALSTLFAFLGLLASRNSLGCNEVDIGTAGKVSK